MKPINVICGNLFYVLDTGTYQPEITCYNDVNSITKMLNGTIVVQNLIAIAKLSLTTSPTRLGDRSSILLQISTGTVFFCHWEFGDGSSFSTDFSFVGNVMYHNYSTVGSYKVATRCTNRLGSQTAQAEVHVDIPIQVVTLEVKKRYIQVMEVFSSVVKATKGSRMTYTWYYGDNTTDSLFRPNVTLESKTHAYKEDGNFQLKVIVSNSLGSVTQALKFLLVVQYPVENITLFSNSPIRLFPGTAIFKIITLPIANVPTNAFCQWDFGDNSDSTGANKEPLTINKESPHTRIRKYITEGFFNVSVNISNAVSSSVLTTLVHVQKIAKVYIVPRHFVNGQLVLGNGFTNNFFLVGEQIVFNCTSQRYDYKYNWNTGDCVTKNFTTITPTITYKYNTPGKFWVTVSVDNTLAQLVATYDVFIQSPILGLVVYAEATYFGDPTKFNINMTQRGSDTCLTIDFDDGYLVTFGNDTCRPKSVPLGINHEFNPISSQTTNLQVSHTFKKMGIYNVTVVGLNKVSRSTSNIFINIKDNACDFPRVQILLEGTADKPHIVKKSDPLLIKHDVWYKCLVGEKVVFTWTAYLTTKSLLDETSKPFPLSDPEKVYDISSTTADLESSFLLIKERTLPFSIVLVSLKVWYIGLERNVSNIYGEDSVWIEVQSSPLFATIRG